MLVSLSVIVHLGLRIAVVYFRGDISQTFDAVVRHVGYMMYAYTLAVGLTTKILPPQWVLDWRVPKNYFPHG
jgi:hypothetical protein